ncbi:MAG: hypothetical protein HYZ46_00400, partial [Nitrosomonadales bacterium]|nr:hypothetical protein [Nitrosomonadales bacterium]
MEKLDKQTVRDMLLQAKDSKSLTWPQLAEKIGRSPVYTAMLVYGYGQTTEDEADALLKVLDLPLEIKTVLMKVPHRQPAQPWPPTDPFVYRFYESIMLSGVPMGTQRCVAAIALRALAAIACMATAAPSSSAGRTDDTQAETVFRDAREYTVRIRTQIETPFTEDRQGSFSGAGFLVDSDRGWIVTNAHVVGQSPSEVKVA